LPAALRWTERGAPPNGSTEHGSRINAKHHVVAETADGGDAAVFLAERLMIGQLDDAHFAAQLVERLKWAGEDAERETAIRQPQMAPPRRNRDRPRVRIA
jgi:hypothetical protein